MGSEKKSNTLSNVKIRKLLDELNTTEQGLSEEEVAKRQKKYGFNEIPEKKQNPLLKFLSYFWGPIPIMIEVAAILSFIINSSEI